MTTLTCVEEPLGVIIARAKIGDEAAWTTLFVRFNQFVYNYALSRTKDPTSSEEIVSEVFLIVYRKLQTLKEDRAFATWLKVIAKNVSTNVLTRNKLALQDSSPEEHFIWDDPAEELATAEAKQKVQAEIRRLNSLIHQEALIDFYLAGKSLKEIAKERSIPIGTVKRRLHDARNKLRESIRVEEYL